MRKQATCPESKRVYLYTCGNVPPDVALQALYRKAEQQSWEVVEVFTAGRDHAAQQAAFDCLLDACRSEKPDLVVTPSLQWFSQNVVDTMVKCRRLRAAGVDVLFDKEGVCTDNMNDVPTLLCIRRFSASPSGS